MQENIKFHPLHYKMSDNLKNFFTHVTKDEKLQEQLYHSKTLTEITSISFKLNYEITAAELLQAQAGRVLAIINERSNDVQRVVSGLKPKTGAQWGRGGKGWLDQAGYWFLSLNTQHPSTNNGINQLLETLDQNQQLHHELLNAHTMAQLAEILQENGLGINAIEICVHQAMLILSLNEADASKIAQ